MYLVKYTIKRLVMLIPVILGVTLILYFVMSLAPGNPARQILGADAVEDDPLLPAILAVYEKQGIKNGAPSNKMKGEAFRTELATAYPDARLVVTKETMTVEGMIKIVYDLLKDLKSPDEQVHPTGLKSQLISLSEA